MYEIYNHKDRIYEIYKQSEITKTQVLRPIKQRSSKQQLLQSLMLTYNQHSQITMPLMRNIQHETCSCISSSICAKANASLVHKIFCSLMSHHTSLVTKCLSMTIILSQPAWIEGFILDDFQSINMYTRQTTICTMHI